jgi:hypothetical protein
MRGKNTMIGALMLALGIVQAGCAAPIRHTANLTVLPRRCDLSEETPDCPRGVFIRDNQVHTIGCANKYMDFSWTYTDNFGTHREKPFFLYGKSGAQWFAETEAICNARGYVPDEELMAAEDDYEKRTIWEKDHNICVAYSFPNRNL